MAGGQIHLNESWAAVTGSDGSIRASKGDIVSVTRTATGTYSVNLSQGIDVLEGHISVQVEGSQVAADVVDTSDVLKTVRLHVATVLTDANFKIHIKQIRIGT